MMFLAEIEKFFKVKLTVSVPVTHAQECFGQAFRQIVALARILFDQFPNFPFLQESVPVRVVLKLTIHGVLEISDSDNDSLPKGRKKPHLVENPTDPLTLRAFLSRIIINLC